MNKRNKPRSFFPISVAGKPVLLDFSLLISCFCLSFLHLINSFSSFLTTVLCYFAVNIIYSRHKLQKGGPAKQQNLPPALRNDCCPGRHMADVFSEDETLKTRLCSIYFNECILHCRHSPRRCNPYAVCPTLSSGTFHPLLLSVGREVAALCGPSARLQHRLLRQGPSLISFCVPELQRGEARGAAHGPVPPFCFPPCSP